MINWQMQSIAEPWSGTIGRQPSQIVSSFDSQPEIFWLFNTLHSLDVFHTIAEPLVWIHRATLLGVMDVPSASDEELLSIYGPAGRTAFELAKLMPPVLLALATPQRDRPRLKSSVSGLTDGQMSDAQALQIWNCIPEYWELTPDGHHPATTSERLDCVIRLLTLTRKQVITEVAAFSHGLSAPDLKLLQAVDLDSYRRIHDQGVARFNHISLNAILTAKSTNGIGDAFDAASTDKPQVTHAGRCPAHLFVQRYVRALGGALAEHRPVILQQISALQQLVSQQGMESVLASVPDSSRSQAAAWFQEQAQIRGSGGQGLSLG